MGCAAPFGVYNHHVDALFHVGDVIRKARERRRWNQDRLGDEAAHYGPKGERLDVPDKRINKSTVSKVETDPFTSEHSTIIRLLAALNLSLSDAEQYLRPSSTARDGPSSEPLPGSQRRAGSR